MKKKKEQRGESMQALLSECCQRPAFRLQGAGQSLTEKRGKISGLRAGALVIPLHPAMGLRALLPAPQIRGLTAV